METIKTFKIGMYIFPILLLITCFYGCSTGPVNVSDIQIFKAKANHIPVVIYGTSFNDANNEGDITRLSVQFLVTSNKAIETVVLFVRNCKGETGKEEGPIVPLSLNGPFQGNTAYMVYPHFSFSESQGWQARRSWHLVIKGVEALGINGSTSICTRDLSNVLTKKIANYCSTILYPIQRNDSIW